jgi:hypothetical protein
MGKAMVQAPCQ